MCKIHILVDESEFSCPKESVNFDDESGGENGSCQRNQSPESGAPRRLWFERNANRISQQSITRVKLESAWTRQVQQITSLYLSHNSGLCYYSMYHIQLHLMLSGLRFSPYGLLSLRSHIGLNPEVLILRWTRNCQKPKLVPTLDRILTSWQVQVSFSGLAYAAFTYKHLLTFILDSRYHSDPL